MRTDLGDVYELSACFEVSKAQVTKLNNKTKFNLYFNQIKRPETSSSQIKLYLANTPTLGIMLVTAYVLDAKMSIENNKMLIFTEGHQATTLNTSQLN
ncbi:13684_t:CDS:2 [Funneliformis geosporum]|uniref:13684_t:CDS:1 n=1 Tax=Funneliformis geosporum TaxID=1117311 RepID=A0A9W4SQR5_9GLOM|nr:13684_t:CDS:2 [Funneliformis geosporum]